MLKKTITYTDFDGVQREEDHYFNLTKAEMIEYDASFQDGAIAHLTFLMNNKMNGSLIMAFKDLILRSYGVKMPNGKFVKSQELRDAFMASEAYSELFMEITSGEDAAAAFINGIIPKVPNAEQKDPHAVAPIG